MKIVVTGKGGAGKTTIAGALARHLAQRGHAVVAVDADPNPNLGIALGLTADAVEGMLPILNGLIAAGHTHKDVPPSADELLSRFGIAGPDGVMLIATGRIERPTGSCLCCGSHTTTRQFIGELSDRDRVVVADLEAGLNDLIWACPQSDDVVMVVTDGSVKSVAVARRAIALAREMGVHRLMTIANRALDDADGSDLAALLGVDHGHSVLEDRAVERADHLGVAAFDASPTSPAMVSIGRLADELM